VSYEMQSELEYQYFNPHFLHKSTILMGISYDILVKIVTVVLSRRFSVFKMYKIYHSRKTPFHHRGLVTGSFGYGA